MDINEFAEQVLFGTSLEEKLLVPGRLSHSPKSSKMPNVEALTSPGRPRHLQMTDDKTSTPKPPSDSQLEDERCRGRLLHFLANHELLATELMALVLLKFPDAPREFRQGVLVTLQEEQEHTRMYLKRMKECGVEFGRFPVSGQFWRVVEPMESPMDFVSRLSLTFEQANLDYSRHYAQVFRRIGDRQTSDVLQQIYEDEISHVKHGLHWFRQWKDPNLSDWDAYQEALEFPMSPQRGRGPSIAFNRDGRKRAGLDSHFIDAIEVFRKSRGRATTVRWFDAGAEARLTADVSPKETNLLDQLNKDLELVMVPLSKRDDIILVNQFPAQKTLKHLINCGFDLPEFTPVQHRASIADRKPHQLSPWAWTPKSYDVAQSIIGAVRNPPQLWNPGWEDLYRKSWAATQLKQWLDDDLTSHVANNSPETIDWFTPASTAGTPIRCLAEIPDALKTIADNGHSKALFKVDLGTAGRGQRQLNCRGLTESDQAWLQTVFAQRANSVENGESELGVIEPELERVADISFLWDRSSDQDIAPMGWTRPLLGPHRQYVGTRLGDPFSSCGQDVKKFLLAQRCRRLQLTAQWLEDRLAPKLSKLGFKGCFGVDALVCRMADDRLSIKPVVELNPRMTMGHIALSLKKRLAAGVVADFRILTAGQFRQWREKLDQIPLVLSDSGHWKSGTVWLGAVDSKTKLIPAVLVGRQAVEISAMIN